MTLEYPAPLLQMDRVSIESQDGGDNDRQRLLEEFSLNVQAGEIVALVGESGSGKTLAARSVLKLLPPGVRKVSGHIVFEGEDLDTAAPARLRALRGGAIGLVMQEPMSALNPAMTIGLQLDEGLRLHRRMTASHRRASCCEMLARVGIAAPERRLACYPHELSGGMRQRIMLASVMLLEPKLLIADEPTTALDTVNQREVLDIMVELARDSGMAVLLISHNLPLVAHYAERLVVLEKGKVVEAGDTRSVLRAPRHAYTRLLVDSVSCRRSGRNPNPGGAERPLLTVRNLRVGFPGKEANQAAAARLAVDDVSLEIKQGEIVAVVGSSGSGKTTLGRALLGLIPHSRGDIELDGIDPRCRNRPLLQAFRGTTQIIFQDPYSSLDPRMRVCDIVAEPLRQFDLPVAESSLRTREMLEEVGIARLVHRFPHQLSGGQRQRVAIARAVITRPKFIVADEPVSALDATIQSQVLALLQKLQTQYRFACLFITHDLRVVERIADRVVVMQAGRIIEAGTVELVFGRPQADYTRRLLAAAPTLQQVCLATSLSREVASGANRAYE